MIEWSCLKDDVWYLIPTAYVLNDDFAFAVGFQWLPFSFEIAYHK